MAWTDRPTKAQINALWHWFYWKMPTEEAKDSLAWLEKNATRKQVSDEMKRVRELYQSNRLNRDECFKGAVWAEYFNPEKRKE